MDDDYLFAVCCPICGSTVSKFFRGARTYIRCSKCSADLFYETDAHGTTVKLTKEPKKPPVVPTVPA